MSACQKLDTIAATLADHGQRMARIEAALAVLPDITRAVDALAHRVDMVDACIQHMKRGGSHVGP